MKLQKVAVILGISVCLIATQMQATFGIEESGQEEDSELTEEEELEGSSEAETAEADIKVTEKEPVKPVKEEEPVIVEEPIIVEEGSDEKGNLKEEDSSAEEEIPKEEEDSGEEDSSAEEEIPKEEEGTGEEETPKEEDTGEEDSSVEEEAPKEEEGTGEEETPKEEEGTGEEETPKEEEGTGEEETPKEEDTGEEDSSAEEETPKEEEGTGEEETPKEEEDSAEEEKTKEEDGSAEEENPREDLEKDNDDSAEKIKDNAGDDQPKSKSAVQKTKGAEAAGKTSKRSNIFSNFTPSSEFIDNRDKVKYNVDVPIDGLPAFITQEMLVGALKCQDETGYPASVTIAQIIQESGFGKYGPDGDKGQGLSYLAYQYNNLFGIKGSGTVGSVAMNTGEQRLDGSRYSITAGFRVYNTYTECIEDRTDLLDRVYKDLIFGVKDANTFAMKIGRRWATSLNYGQNLIRQMNRYDLYRLDSMTLDEFSGMIGTFANPCPGARLTSDFGYRDAPIAGASTYHKGIDLGTGAYNIPTYAAEAGTVIYAGPSGAAGNLVTIDHGNGLVTKYMHHDKIYVKPGDKVEKGQQIGLSGSTGNSTGNHLHFQVEKDGTAIDPLSYLDIR